MRGKLERDAAGDVALTTGAGRTPPWVKQRHGERRFGDWRKAQFAQGVIPRELLCGGIVGE